MAHQKQHSKHATTPRPFMVMKMQDHRTLLFRLVSKWGCDRRSRPFSPGAAARWERISYRKERRRHTRGFIGFFHELCAQSCPRFRLGKDEVPGNRFSHVRCARPVSSRLHLLPIASTTNVPSSTRSRLLCDITLSRSLFRPKAVGLREVLCYILTRTSQPIYRACDGSYTRLYTPFRTSTILPRTAWPKFHTVFCERSTASFSMVCPSLCNVL